MNKLSQRPKSTKTCSQYACIFLIFEKPDDFTCWCVGPFVFALTSQDAVSLHCVPIWESNPWHPYIFRTFPINIWTLMHYIPPRMHLWGLKYQSIHPISILRTIIRPMIFYSIHISSLTAIYSYASSMYKSAAVCQKPAMQGRVNSE